MKRRVFLSVFTVFLDCRSTNLLRLFSGNLPAMFVELTKASYIDWFVHSISCANCSRFSNLSNIVMWWKKGKRQVSGKLCAFRFYYQIIVVFQTNQYIFYVLLAISLTGVLLHFFILSSWKQRKKFSTLYIYHSKVELSLRFHGTLMLK